MARADAVVLFTVHHPQVGADVARRCYWDFGDWSDAWRDSKPTPPDLTLEVGVCTLLLNALAGFVLLSCELTCFVYQLVFSSRLLTPTSHDKAREFALPPQALMAASDDVSVLRWARCAVDISRAAAAMCPGSVAAAYTLALSRLQRHAM